MWRSTTLQRDVLPTKQIASLCRFLLGKLQKKSRPLEIFKDGPQRCGQ